MSDYEESSDEVYIHPPIKDDVKVKIKSLLRSNTDIYKFNKLLLDNNAVIAGDFITEILLPNIDNPQKIADIYVPLINAKIFVDSLKKDFGFKFTQLFGIIQDMEETIMNKNYIKFWCQMRLDVSPIPIFIKVYVCDIVDIKDVVTNLVLTARQVWYTGNNDFCLSARKCDLQLLRDSKAWLGQTYHKSLGNLEKPILDIIKKYLDRGFTIKLEPTISDESKIIQNFNFYNNEYYFKSPTIINVDKVKKAKDTVEKAKEAQRAAAEAAEEAAEAAEEAQRAADAEAAAAAKKTTEAKIVMRKITHTLKIDETATAALETATTALETATTTLKTANAALESANAALETAQKELETAQKEFETAKKEFETAIEAIKIEKTTLTDISRNFINDTFIKKNQKNCTSLEIKNISDSYIGPKWYMTALFQYSYISLPFLQHADQAFDFILKVLKQLIINNYIVNKLILEINEESFKQALRTELDRYRKIVRDKQENEDCIKQIENFYLEEPGAGVPPPTAP
jgi:hypothetical protein